MKARKMLVLSLVLIIMTGMFSNAGATNIPLPANLPWLKQSLREQDDIHNLSAAFVGNYHIPILSYTRTGYGTIWQAHLATTAVPGDCGPNNSWNCETWSDPDLIPGTLSNMAGLPLTDTHLIKWVYVTTVGYLKGRNLELYNDMSYATSQLVNLLQISKFGATVIEAPSLIAIGSHYRLAVTIRDSTDLYGHQLVYMHFTGVNNTSCVSGGSGYQCDVIDSSYGYGSMGVPSLQVAPDGTVGIAYYKSGKVMYAYPHTDTVIFPSNCGPGGNTWRCITLFAGQPTGVVGSTVKLALGKTSGERGIAFTYDDEMIPITLYHADYVGSGGNCGLDGPLGFSEYKWQCQDIIYFYYLHPSETPAFSIDIDPAGYSVIAYQHAVSDMGNRDLYLVYPDARLGLGGSGWHIQQIDWAPVLDVNRGAQAALAISEGGLGLIGYLEQQDYETDILRAARQQWLDFLPLAARY